MEKEFKTKTLFVQNLPFTTTNDQLEELFSEIGPLKKCFVVAKKDDKASCKGVGFVTFASEDDISAALKKSLHLGGRKLLLNLAGKDATKSKQKKRKRSKDDENEDQTNTVVPAAETEEEQSAKEERKAAKKEENVSSEAAARTVIVHGVTDEETVTASAGNPKSIRSIRFSVSVDGEKLANILYRGKKDAIVAARRFLRNKMTANVLGREMKEKSQPAIVANPKKSRLIVRNLAFKCEDGELKKVFAEFGDVMEVSIPKKANGKKLGFGIIQFSAVESAARAVEEMNGKSILGRPVAVDWSLPKSKYERLNQQTGYFKSVFEDIYVLCMVIGNVPSLRRKKEAADDDAKKKQTCKKKRKEVQDEEKDDSNEEESGEDDNEDEADAEEDDSEEIDVSDEEDEMQDSFGIEASDDEEKGDDEDDTEEDDNENDDDDDDDDDDSDNEDESDSSSDSEPKAKQRKTDKPKPVQRKQDVDQGRTVFIRNLSFESMEEDLEEFMEEQFGEVTYCRVVTDKAMEHSKGTAFVQFKTKEQAEECINASLSMDGLALDGRKLLVSVALPKEKADELASHQKKEKVDKRNLHLIRVGLIRPGTQEAAGLSKADLVKRMKVETITRQKLKNPNVFVSATRLCIRNIPVNVDDQSLRKTFLKACGNPKSRITECRIMRDLDRVGNNGLGKSRGYGFVNFETHEDAMTALNTTNNNPEIYGESRRLIVEFSLENKSALIAKQRRMDRNQFQAKKETPKSTKFEPKIVPTTTNVKKETPKSTKFEPKIVPATTNVKKGLPSHWGPKIRHKARPTQKITTGMKQKTIDVEEKKKKRKNKKKKGIAEVRDNLDELINNYRKKFSAV